MKDRIREEIKRHGKLARGRKELIAYLDGGRLTARQTCLAHCYSCMAYYADGRADCGCSDCPTYAFMPFRKGGKLPPTRKISENQRKAMSDRIKKSILRKSVSTAIVNKEPKSINTSISSKSDNKNL